MKKLSISLVACAIMLCSAPAAAANSAGYGTQNIHSVHNLTTDVKTDTIDITATIENENTTADSADTSQQHEEPPTIHLGNDNTNTTVPIEFSAKSGTLVDDNVFTMIPGDSIHSELTIVNNGASDGVLTAYVTNITASSQTTLKEDDWFHEVQFSTNVDTTPSSLYNVITREHLSDHGAEFVQQNIPQGESLDLELLLEFPEDATAGNTTEDRNFGFSVALVLEEDASQYADDSEGTDSGSSGEDATNDADNTAGHENMGSIDSENDAIDSDTSQQQDNPSIISGFPGGNIGLGITLILLGVAGVVMWLFTKRTRRNNATIH